MTKRQGKSASATVKDILLQEPDGLRDVIRLVLQEVLEARMGAADGAEPGHSPDSSALGSGSSSKGKQASRS